MPLEQRVIEPIHTSRGTLPFDASGNLAINIPNELECVTNGTLANVIRQLSSLSKYAEDLFGSIISETKILFDRTSGLQGRIDRIAIKVTQLDSSVDEVSLLDAQKKTPFKSSTSYDQQVVSRSTMPASLMEQYKLCDTPPPLSKLNAYRDDNKDGLKFYTDPSYFFELWKTQEMSQVTEREARRKPGHKVSKSNVPSHANGILPNSIVTDRSKKPRPPNNSRIKYQEDARDPEFLPAIPAHSCIAAYHSDANGGYSASHLHQAPYHPHPDAYGTLRRPNSLEVENRHVHPSSTSNLNNSHGNHQVPQAHPQQQQQQQHLQYQQQSNQQHLQHYPHPSHQYPPPQASPGTSLSQYSGQSVCSVDGQSTPTNRKLSTGGSSMAGSRPSQPPPAPPSSSSSSGQVTPTQVGTPSRGSRGASLTRDVLPPPPLPPGLDASVNGISDHVNMHNSNHVHHIQQNTSSVPPPPPLPSSMNTVATAAQNSLSSLNKTNGSSVTHTSSAPVPPPPPPPPPMDGLINHKIQTQSQGNNYPPPISNDETDGSNVISNSASNKQNESLTNGININNNRLASTPSFAQQIVAKHSQLQPATARNNSNNNRLGLPDNVSMDARTELLAAIREGKQLRRVEGIRQREVERTGQCNDVASILARRAAIMELSDSDSGGGGDSDCESDPWNDEGHS